MCREHAARVHLELAMAAEAALSLPDESFTDLHVRRSDIAVSAKEHRELAKAFTGQPGRYNPEERLRRGGF